MAFLPGTDDRSVHVFALRRVFRHPMLEGFGRLAAAMALPALVATATVIGHSIGA